MKIKNLLFSVLVLLCANGLVGQSIWTNPITGTDPGFTSPYTTGQTIVANLSVSGVVRGSGIAGNAGANRYNTNGYNTVFDGNDYIQFTLTPLGGYELDLVSFVYSGTASATGPTSFAVRSSLDGYASDIATPSAAGATISLAAAQFQNLSSAIIFRVYGWGASASSGTFSINDFTFNGTLSTPTVDWCNLQFPGNTTIALGGNATFYAQVYEPAVTPGAGQGAGITAWIGYSAADTNPSSAGWTWVPATYNPAVTGSNDEYSATFGAALPEGTYYVASRFRLGSGVYSYGGFSLGGGNFWDGTTYRSALLTINGPTTLDFANLQSPPNGSLVLGGGFDVYAQLYEPGVTDTAGSQGGGITVWIGYSTSNTNPNSAGWTWTEATFNPFGGGTNNDEYILDIGTVIPTSGTYYYASRFQLDTGAYRYGGIQASGINGNFWDGTEYISGVLTVTLPPMQEIKVNGNTGGGTGPITDGSTTTTGLNSTSFGTTPIGTPIVKSFLITNDGTANLTLSGAPIVTIGGTNPADFTVTIQPSTTTIAPAATTTFTISFNPTAVGARTATVSFANNDTDENPFNFTISGNGQCGTTGNTVTPLSGPVGTEVTITATSNNLTGATVTFNGVAAMVTPVSSTQVKVLVPAGATTGTLQTTNAEGCSATTYFTVIDYNIASCQGNTGTARNTLFISEVTDHGSGSHSYVEIFNATGAPVSLNGWSVRTHNNGATTATGTINLNNVMLANNTAYVVAFGGTDHNANWGSITPNQTSSAVSGINDNDNIRLYQGSTWIDVWGNTNGTAFTLAPKDYVYRRKNIGITAPSTTWNPSDWDALTPVNYSNVGQYSFSVGALPFITSQPAYTPSCKATSFTVAATEGFVGGNPLSYQWYAVAPNATAWTALTNAGVYSGATSATLNISSIAGLNGYQYYVQVREDSATCYTASNAVKITVETSTWNGSSWSPFAPTSGRAAVINGNYNTAAHGSFEACSLTVNGGFTLTVSDNNYVSIQNDLTVSNTATLQVLNQGSLVMVENNGVVTNNGTTQIQKTTSPYNKFDYTYWSSPVTATTINTALPGWRTDYAFQFATANYADIVAPVNGFDDDNNAWQFVGGAAVMTPGKGYAVMAPTTGSFPATSTVTFSGTVNNGIISLPMALSGNAANANDDFNLIGNPYPSAIFADDFINANVNTSGTLYFWTHRTGISSSNPGPDANNFITADYAMYNLSGGTSSGTGSPVPNGFVASGQGFFVEAVTATNVVFNNSMRSRLHPNNQFYRINESATANEKDRVWLNLESQDGLFSQQLIGYFPEATTDFDRGYDGIVNHTTNTISFYSFIGEDKYRIQGRPAFDENEQLPLGYSTTIAGDYTVKIGNREGQLNADGRRIYLEDKLLGITHDLTEEPYIFDTAVGTFNDRFLLKYLDGALGIGDSTQQNAHVIAYASNEVINIRSNQNMSKIEIFDIAGRQVYSDDSVDDVEVFIAGLSVSHQALIVRITLENGQSATRKIIF